MPDRPDAVSEWLAAARLGSSDALGQALDACRGYLLTIAEQELEPDLRAKGGASDLVQETFLKAHRHFARFEGDSEAALRAWLRRMLLNHLADFRSLFKEADKRQVAREVSMASDSSGDRGGGPADPRDSPSRQCAADEQSAALQRVLDRLPEDYRQVLQMRYQEEMTFEQIARIMGRSANAVQKLWARAIERLQAEWEQRA
jgi:RNA polymerase sigma-70 factor (ECF subfamily)